MLILHKDGLGIATLFGGNMGKIIVVPATPAGWKTLRRVFLITYILLAILYATVTPIFEVSDEVSHYPLVDYIATHGELPVQDINRPHAWDWEAAQPPLYYVLAALLVTPFDRSDLYTNHWIPNPHAQVGISDTTHNRNVMVHDWEAQSFPWQGTPLHVRIVRGFSIVLSAASVWFIFAIGRQLAPQTPGIAALMMALTAFNPMFIAIGASVNNDNLVTLLLTLSLVIGFSIWQDGFTWSRAWVLAIVCVLAAGSKLSGTYALVIAGLTIMLMAYQRRLTVRQLLLVGLIFVLLWGILLGWWYLRNWQLYDDPLGNTHMAKTVGLRQPSISMIELLRDEWFSFYVAYWGGFGLLTYTAPPLLFYYTGMLIGLAVLGGLWAASRIVQHHVAWAASVPFLLLMLLLGMGVAGVISWSLLTPASQGRLLFPFNASIVALLAFGLHRLLRSRLALVTTLPIGGLAVYCGMWIIPAAFALPPTVDEVPANAQRIQVSFDAITLLAVEIDEEPITHADPTLKATLYWQTAPTNHPLSYFVVVYGRNHGGELVVLGKRDSYPCYGLCATDRWPTNRIYAEEISIELDQWPDDLDLPLQPRLHIGMRDNATNTTLSAQDIANTTLDAVFVHGGRIIAPHVHHRDHLAVEFANMARLYDVQVQQTGNAMVVDVRWEPLQPQAQDLTVFVQLIRPNEPQPVLTNGDRPPRQGWWPTSDWIPHNTFSDHYVLPLDGIPSGEYELLIGWYHPQTFMRVPVRDGLYPDAYVQRVTVIAAQ